MLRKFQYFAREKIKKNYPDQRCDKEIEKTKIFVVAKESEFHVMTFIPHTTSNRTGVPLIMRQSVVKEA